MTEVLISKLNTENWDFEGRDYVYALQNLAMIADARFDAVTAADTSIHVALDGVKKKGAERYEPLISLVYEDLNRDFERNSSFPVATVDFAPAPRLSGHWYFWGEWYHRAMTGDPLPWDLQEQIALIPDEIWEAGPEAVADEIERIRSRYELVLRIGELEARLAEAEVSRHGIGGNSPPEPIRDDLGHHEAVTIIFAPIEDLREQLDAQTPNKDAIARAISKLKAVLSVCGAWAGNKLDAAATEFVKKIGAAGGVAAAAWLVAQKPGIQAVLDAAVRWLASLP
ncbi:MAG: hypothetical protein AAGA70_08220 [Pseudomonadota bacterium]